MKMQPVHKYRCVSFIKPTQYGNISVRVEASSSTKSTFENVQTCQQSSIFKSQKDSEERRFSVKS